MKVIGYYTWQAGEFPALKGHLDVCQRDMLPRCVDRSRPNDSTGPSVSEASIMEVGRRPSLTS